MKTSFALVIGILYLALNGCSTAPESTADRQILDNDVAGAREDFKQVDTSLRGFIDRAYGYVIFPSVGKGGVLAGGAYGRGEVFVGGKQVGFATMTEATIGAQLGGQEFAEIIVFENKYVFEDFTAGDFVLSAQVSAVAIRASAAASTEYHNHVAVFVNRNGGLMGEATVGGQKFEYEPL